MQASTSCMAPPAALSLHGRNRGTAPLFRAPAGQGGLGVEPHHPDRGTQWHHRQPRGPAGSVWAGAGGEQGWALQGGRDSALHTLAEIVWQGAEGVACGMRRSESHAHKPTPTHPRPHMHTPATPATGPGGQVPGCGARRVPQGGRGGLCHSRHAAEADAGSAAGAQVRSGPAVCSCLGVCFGRQSKWCMIAAHCFLGF